MQSVNLTREQAELVFYELMSAHVQMMCEVELSKKKITTSSDEKEIIEAKEWLKTCSDYGDRLIEVATIMRDVMYEGHEKPECITID